MSRLLRRQEMLLRSNNAGGGLPSPIFNLNGQTSLIPAAIAVTGSPTPTFTRATTAYQTDFEGKLNLALSGEARFQGARRVYNRALTGSNDLSSAGWVKVNTSVSGEVLTGTTTPTYGANIAYQGNGNVIAAPANSKWNLTLDLKSGTSTKATIFINGIAGVDRTAVEVTLTADYKRYTVSTTFSSGATSGYFHVAVGWVSDGTGGIGTISARNAQIENVTGQTNQNPSEYVSVGVLSSPYQGAGVDGVQYFSTLNGNTVASNVVTQATGAAIVTGASGVSATAPVNAGGPFGYLAEGARTNLALQSQAAFNNASYWTKTDVTVSDSAVVAPDGTTTASTITESATTNIHRFFSASVLSATETQFTLSAYLQYNTRQWATLGLVSGGTEVFMVVDLQAGTITQANKVGATATYTSSSIITLPNGWYRVTLNGTISGSNCVLNIGTSNSATPGTSTPSYLGSTANKVNVWGAQAEAQAAFATTYIPTTTTALARNADVLTYAASGNISGTVGSAYAEITFAALLGVPSTLTAATGDTAGIIYFAANNSHFYDGTNDNTGPAYPAAGTLTKHAASWGNSAVSISVNGTNTTGLPFNNAMNVGTNFSVGLNGQYTTRALFGTIRNVRIYNRALSSGQLQAMTR